jgi:hypothetical protein
MGDGGTWWRLGLVVGMIVVAAGGCGDRGTEGPSAPMEGESRVGGRVVSTVDGEPITVDDVERVAGATGLPPEAALRRLQRFRLLAREAERRGLRERPAVRAAGRRAAVQALLAREVESPGAATDGSAVGVQGNFERLVGLVGRLESVYGVQRHPEHGMEALAADPLGEAAP